MFLTLHCASFSEKEGNVPNPLAHENGNPVRPVGIVFLQMVMVCAAGLAPLLNLSCSVLVAAPVGLTTVFSNTSRLANELKLVEAHETEPTATRARVSASVSDLFMVVSLSRLNGSSSHDRPVD